MTQKPFECVVSADLFRRAHAAVSGEETRYYINGVNIEPCPSGQGAVLVGTDGHRLIAVRDGNAVIGDRSGIVRLNPAMVKALAAKARRGGPAIHRVLAVRGRCAAVVEFTLAGQDLPDYASALDQVDSPTNAVVAYQWCETVIDGQFPNWRAAVGEPAKSNAPIGSVNIQVLEPIVLALNAGGGSPGFRFWPASSGAIFAIPYSGEIEGFGIVMAMRGSDARPAVPTWLKPQSAPAAA